MIESNEENAVAEDGEFPIEVGDKICMAVIFMGEGTRQSDGEIVDVQLNKWDHFSVVAVPVGPDNDPGDLVIETPDGIHVDLSREDYR